MLSFNSGTAADNVPESATFLFDWCIMNEWQTSVGLRCWDLGVVTLTNSSLFLHSPIHRWMDQVRSCCLDEIRCSYLLVFLTLCLILGTLPQEPSCCCCCCLNNNNKEEARSLHENCHKFCFTSLYHIPGFRTSQHGPTCLFLVPSFALNTHNYEKHKNFPVVYSAFVSDTQRFFYPQGLNKSWFGMSKRYASLLQTGWRVSGKE